MVNHDLAWYCILNIRCKSTFILQLKMSDRILFIQNVSIYHLAQLSIWLTFPFKAGDKSGAPSVGDESGAGRQTTNDSASNKLIFIQQGFWQNLLLAQAATVTKQLLRQHQRQKRFFPKDTIQMEDDDK